MLAHEPGDTWEWKESYYSNKTCWKFQNTWRNSALFYKVVLQFLYIEGWDDLISIWIHTIGTSIWNLLGICIFLEVDQLIFQSLKKHTTWCWQDYFARNSFTFEYLHNLSMAFLLYLGQKRNLVGNSGIHNLLYIFITHAFLINMLRQPCTYKKL